jgi:branched-subunit amino acid transport protein
MTTWIVLLTIGAGTYALRASMFVALRTRSLPARLNAPMTLIAPAAIAALVASMLFTSSGRVDPSSVAEVAAVAAGVVAVRRTGQVMHAFAVGLPVLWIVTAIAG